MPTRLSRWTIVVCLLCLAAPAGALSKPSTPGPWTAETHDDAGDPEARVTAAMSELPLCFEANAGQIDDRVAFRARTSGMGVFLTPDELVLSLPRSAPDERTGPDPDSGPASAKRSDVRATPLPPAVVRMRLASAGLSTPVGEQQLVTKTNYFLGNDPERWRTDVPNFGRVRYPEVYPGVDLVYYGRGGRLEYDFVVAPGADPSAISMVWEGAESIETSADGALVMKVGGVELRQMPPALYQEDGGGRRAVAGRFEVLGDGRVGVNVGDYDRGRPLVIDPLLVRYSTFLGGGGAEEGKDIAVDEDGAAYVTGKTFSADFPLENPYDSTFNDSDHVDIFVTKLDPSGAELVYSTYLGGDDRPMAGILEGETVEAVTVDDDDAAVITGFTTASDFPTHRAYDATIGSQTDVYVTKLGPAGNTLRFSTFLGGSGNDYGYGIAEGPDGTYVTGETWSSNFPVKTAYDASHNGGADVFVTRLHLPSGSSSPLVLDSSTFLGGSKNDRGYDVDVDTAGTIYVAGSTTSNNFPVENAYDPTANPGASGTQDGFLTKLSAAGDALLNSTYFGGTGPDWILSLAVSPSRAIYVAGQTTSSNFPTWMAYDDSLDGQFDAFAAKFGQASSAPSAALGLAYSTFLGGGGDDGALDIAVDGSGAARVVGVTDSVDFPVVAPYDAHYASLWDGFALKLDATGQRLTYSTYLGGSADDWVNAVAVDASGAAYITGVTSSSSFPTTVGAYDTHLDGRDAFVMKLWYRLPVGPS